MRSSPPIVKKRSASSKHATTNVPHKKRAPEQEQILLFKKTQTKVSPYTKQLKRYAKRGVKSLLLSPAFHGAVKIITIALFVSGVLYGSYHYISKTFANEVIVSQGEIVARVAKLIMLPNEDPYEVARVQDEEDLRKQNPFYSEVKEGDYILMYKNMVIIYDLRNNIIVALKKTK